MSETANMSTVNLKKQYHFQNIRSLLLQGFSEKDLRKFCRYAPEFQTLLPGLSDSAPLDDIVDKIIDFANRKLLVDALLQWANKENPRRYAECRPYYDADVEKVISQKQDTLVEEQPLEEKTKIEPEPTISASNYWSKIIGMIGGAISGMIVGVPTGMAFVSPWVENPFMGPLVGLVGGIIIGAISGWFTGSKVWIETFGIFAVSFIGASVGAVVGAIISYSRFSDPQLGGAIGASAGILVAFFTGIPVSMVIGPKHLERIIKRIIGQKIWDRFQGGISEDILKAVIYIVCVPFFGALLGWHIGSIMTTQITANTGGSETIFYWATVGIMAGGFLAAIVMWTIMVFLDSVKN